MKIQLKVTVQVSQGPYTKEQIIEALCEQFKHGGDIYFVMQDGMELIAIAQDAEEFEEE